jgi:hypothetical protein
MRGWWKRVAEKMIAQQRQKPIDEREWNEIAGRVVEVHVAEAVEQRILTRAEVVERTRAGVHGVGSSENVGCR